MRELAGRADIVLENDKPGTLARYGLNAESLHGVDRRLIVCSLTGFGATSRRTTS